ncbi:MAG: hypothetical protein HUU38_24970 [Anaerolineales bacterium]|nr:hypothetical protein [Anaerolineales bacterium]
MKNPSPNKTVWFVLTMLAMVGIVVTGAAIGAAQTPEMATMQNPPKVWIVAGEPSANPVKNLPPQEFLLNAPQTANITVNYIGSWDSNAQAAFEYAVSIWETQITSPIPIIVEAEWGIMEGNTLGGARAATLISDFSNAPVANTWYPVALANKLAGTDLYSGVDIFAEFNSAYPNWYFGTNGNPGGSIDFVSVVLHEIGHGLGFFGLMSYGNSCGGSDLGCWAPQQSNIPSIYDRFTENEAGAPLLSFPNYSSQLGSQLTSNVVYFDGPNANAANGNSRVPLITLIPNLGWRAGSSYSHLAESFNGTANALMTYSIGPGEANHAPGPVMLGMFTDMGWSIAAGPTATPTKTPTKTPLPTCTPFPTITPQPTMVGASNVYAPIISRGVTNCLPYDGGPIPTKTPTPTGGWTNLLTENFEGSFPGAWVMDDNTSGQYQWGKRTCQVFEGSSSGWGIGGGSLGSGLGCGGTYPNDIVSVMISPSFSLVGATDAEMIMKGWVSLEDGWDEFCFYASINNNNFYGDCYSADTVGWEDFVLDLTNVYTLGDLRGQPNVWVAIGFFSDSSFNEPHGVYVDNIVVRKCTGGTCTSLVDLPDRVVKHAQIELAR